MSKTARLSELGALTVDAYNDEEQLVGFLVGADEALQGGRLRQSSVSQSKSSWLTRDLTRAPV